LPSVVEPGKTLDKAGFDTARKLGIPEACIVRAGTTDSIAAFFATEAVRPGTAVTSLGSTLVIKLLSESRVEAPESGVYSHRLGRRWLAGGASNSGGAVLRQFFGDSALATLSARIDPARPSGLDFYPLPTAGERFPVNDPGLKPRMAPRPHDDALFLQGLLEGMAAIEKRGYAVLAELGATPVANILTTGGGAKNPSWQRIRSRVLGVPVATAAHAEAAFGAARLACLGPALLRWENHEWTEGTWPVSKTA
jgi:sugar (pentulose or hexulose) kinase